MEESEAQAKHAQNEKKDTTEPVSLNKQPSSIKPASYHFSSVNQISLCGVYANKSVACAAWCGVMK